MRPIQPPNNCSIEQFLLEERYGRHPIQASLNPFTCGITSKTRTTLEVKQLVSLLAQGLAEKLGWHTAPSDQLERVAKAIFTSPSLLQTALKATRATNIPDSHVFLIEPTETTPSIAPEAHFKSIQDLVNLGRNRPLMVQPRWQDSRQNDEQLAFLSFSSGTSGSPVPTIMVNILSNMDTVAKYDLSSSVEIFIGAAPLGHDIFVKTAELFPHWKVLQGYGLTEAGAVVSLTRRDDIWLGSSGVPLDGIECRLLSENGEDLKDLSNPGELVIRSPAVASGYFCNEEATQETFQDGWLRTGDIALFKRSPKGNLHLFIVDRVKDLIKVKGMQVSPTELEAHLLLHAGVAEAAVVGIEDPIAGEIPKAFIVPSTGGQAQSSQDLSSSIARHVEENKAKYKWLRGGIEFVQALPKTPSGKVTRRPLRDAARRKAKGEKKGSRL
ncbi:phenylacetyl ligase [Fusarium pseudoanthophilum]|uniref:Phenylacetyl ligase n=1 Tax=Fusarium pseudoanthophilum TaxID=48495 RepID=A0A8H5NV14_9HYPO|nr:phenylacetyl ligase [Fusarium pseudoanthophilum]